MHERLNRDSKLVPGVIRNANGLVSPRVSPYLCPMTAVSAPADPVTSSSGNKQARKINE